MKGRTIRMFLVDGVPTGVLTAEIINWTGKIIVAPRAQLSDLAKREEVRRTGCSGVIRQDGGVRFLAALAMDPPVLPSPLTASRRLPSAAHPLIPASAAARMIFKNSSRCCAPCP